MANRALIGLNGTLERFQRSELRYQQPASQERSYNALAKYIVDGLLSCGFALC